MKTQKITTTTGITTYAWENGVMSESAFGTVIRTAGTENRRCRLYATLTMPTLPTGAHLTKAELTLTQSGSSFPTGMAPILLLSRVTEAITTGTVTPAQEPQPIEFDWVKANIDDGSRETYTFDITRLADICRAENTDTVGIVLAMQDENLVNNTDYRVTLYSPGVTGDNGEDYSPRIALTYEQGYGLGNTHRTHTHELGRFGQGSLDLVSGHLMFETEDFAWSGNRMPITIKHQYNSALAKYPYTRNVPLDLQTADFSAMKLGNGWRLNLMQSLVQTTTGTYIYIDENGEETTLTTKDGVVKSEDEDLTYDPATRVLTQGDDHYAFDEAGRLIGITDADNNAITLTYTDNRLTAVTDPVGRAFTFAYNANGNLTKITAPDGSSISYYYDYYGENLNRISYPCGKSVMIEGGTNGITAVMVYAQNRPGQRVEYTYKNGRVSKIKEYGVTDSGYVEGATSTYTYSDAARRTVVETSEPADTEAGETEPTVITTVYTFDGDFNDLGEYVYTVEDGNAALGGGSSSGSNASGIHPYAGENGAGLIAGSVNLLRGHDFTSTDAWIPMTGNAATFTADLYELEAKQASDNIPYGRTALRLTSADTAAVSNGVYQQSIALPAGDYAFSAYLRIKSKTSGDSNANFGGYIRVTDLAGNTLAVSEKIMEADYRYVRVVAPFTLTAQQAVRTEILLDGSGVLYADAAQLEDNAYASPYNLLENGNFELSSNAWTCAPAVSVTEETCFNMTRSVKMESRMEVIRQAYQDVAVKTEKTTRESFTLSGWAKATALVARKRTLSDNETNFTPTFRLMAQLIYKDGETEEVTAEVETETETETETTPIKYEPEEFTADFSTATEDWQFASVTFEKSHYAELSCVRVFCDYSYNVGTAYFDDIRLTRDGVEYLLSAEDFAGEDDGDDSGSESAEDYSDTAPAFAEATDGFGNTLTETTFEDGKFGTIYRSFGFSENGNDLVRETDARGNTTTYEVDPVTSRNREVTDRCGNKTAYEYDADGRTTKVTSKKADGTELANVSYAYDTFDNLTAITRGDGLKYALTYNAFRNLESIGITGKTDGALVRYTYKNGNGRLKAITYANGDTMKATYNTAGQMIAEKWYNASNTLTAHYKYVYDGDGNIVRSLDIKAEKEYTYEYREGNLIRAAEYTITVDAETEIITAKTLVNTVIYVYDKDGTLGKKSLLLGDDTERVVYYENPENGNPVTETRGGYPTYRSHSKNDHFGRKEFEELQLGAKSLSRRFSYHEGVATTEHTTREMVKSEATTALVSKITFSDGRTLFYEYDEEERITKVTDSVDGVTEYTYDALGQLLTETVNGTVVNTMTYDNYGNIVSKNGVAYGYDTTWKDKLVSYGGQTISYDAQGNPTSYLGHTLMWEKGRQLKTFIRRVNNAPQGAVYYTYNANGIRTSKTIDGIRHDYVLDGAKILKESWITNSGVLQSLVPLYDNEDAVCGIVYNDVPYYFLKNQQGDIIAITDANATVVARYTYDAWGVPTITQDTTTVGIATINPYRYRGYYYDTEISMYYLQSRYYNPTVGRFVNGDDTVFLGLGKSIMSYNLITYCENDCNNYVDYFGHAPSLVTLTRMHNAVIQSAQRFLFSVGTLTSAEVRTCNARGKYIGRMDIYSYISNRVWEVKRNNAAGIRAGNSQLSTYVSSYVYSLYHSWLRTYRKPRYGNISVYGSAVVAGYLVVYCSHATNPALITYDYITLEEVAKVLLGVTAYASAAFYVELEKFKRAERQKVLVMLFQIAALIKGAVKLTEEVVKVIGDFIKTASPVVLMIVAIVLICACGVALA